MPRTLLVGPHRVPIWNIPVGRNRFFTGRQQLLERLHTHLQTAEAAALSQPQTISGLGGIGKTQLALEYAHRYAQEYQAVLWVRAETTEALNTSYTEVVELLQLPQKDAQEQAVIVQAVKAWLTEHPGWLLLMDNADDLDLVQSFLPSRCPGHFLLTTRAQITGKVARWFEVDVLDGEVGALLLLRRAGLVAEGGSFEMALPAGRSIAQALSTDLGGLSLAPTGPTPPASQPGSVSYERNLSHPDFCSFFASGHLYPAQPGERRAEVSVDPVKEVLALPGRFLKESSRHHGGREEKHLGPVHTCSCCVGGPFTRAHPYTELQKGQRRNW